MNRPEDFQLSERSRVLFQEFAKFLEGLDMGGKSMDQDDPLTISKHFASISRASRTVSDLSERLTGHLDTLYLCSPSKPTLSSREHTVWQYSSFRDAGLKDSKWYLGWGIRFPDADESDAWTSFQPPLPGASHLFVTIGTEGKALPKQMASQLGEGWVDTKPGEAVIGRSLESFHFGAKGSDFEAEATSWVQRYTNEACMLLRASP